MLGTRLGAGAGMLELPDQGVQIEAAVDAVLGLGQITVAVIAEVEMMIRAADGRFAVGNEGIDPTKRLQITGFARADDDSSVGRNLRAGRGETGKTIGDQVDLGIQR